MLSIHPISANATQACAYYFADTPTVSSQSQSPEPPKWFGALAISCPDLEPTVTPATLELALKGTLGDATVRYLRPQRLAGYDLTLSAPKSVSVLALVGGDHRLFSAHQAAVEHTLLALEQNTAQTRSTDPNTHAISFQATHQSLFALFNHTTSRADEPQLHTHCLMLNMTRDAKQRLCAIASSTQQPNLAIQGTMAKIYHHQKYYTAMYQGHLAEAVTAMGYTTHGVGQHQFEIDQIPKNILRTFSTRSQQIQARLATQPWRSAQAKSIAARDTRSDKSPQSQSALRQQWQQQLGGFDLLACVQRNQPSAIAADPNRTPPDAQATIHRAIAQLSQTQTAFHSEQVILSAMAQTPTRLVNPIQYHQAALNASIDQGDLIRLHGNDTLLSTPSLIQQEQRLRYTIDKMVTDTPPSRPSTQGQAKAQRQTLDALVQSPQQLHILHVDGDRTQLHQQLQQRASEQHFKLAIIPASTGELSHLPPKTMLVIDAAQTLQRPELYRLIEHSQQQHQRLILCHAMGHSNRSNALTALTQTYTIAQHRWQQHAPPQPQVRIYATPQTAMHQTVAAHYLAQAQPEQWHMITSKSHVQPINQAIRTQMQQHGQLSATSQNIPCQTIQRLTPNQSNRASAYTRKMQLTRWNHGNPIETVRVVDRNCQSNLIVVAAAGQRQAMDPSRTAFKKMNWISSVPTTLNIAVGDRLRCATTAHHYHVRELNDTHLKLQDQHGSSWQPHSALTDQYLSYVYTQAFTEPSSPELNRIVVLKNHACTSTWLNTILNQADNVDFFTDNIGKLTQKIKKCSIEARIIHPPNENTHTSAPIEPHHPPRAPKSWQDHIESFIHNQEIQPIQLTLKQQHHHTQPENIQHAPTESELALTQAIATIAKHIEPIERNEKNLDHEREL